MSAVVLLDSGPLGLLSNPHNLPQPIACRQWASRLQAAGRRIIVPEITDYEVRRELLRVNRSLSIVLLDALAQQLEYLPLTTTAMRKAAELWAQARQQGQPTAGDNTIDCDMILAAQALTLGAAAVEVTAGRPVGAPKRSHPCANRTAPSASRTATGASRTLPGASLSRDVAGCRGMTADARPTPRRLPMTRAAGRAPTRPALRAHRRAGRGARPVVARPPRRRGAGAPRHEQGRDPQPGGGASSR